MKFVPVLLALVVMLYAASASPPARRRDHRPVLVNRPTKEEIFNSRVRRSDQFGVKGQPVPIPRPVRKGEYECGNKICKLVPGEIPKGCKGCQYPILISDFIQNQRVGN